MLDQYAKDFALGQLFARCGELILEYSFVAIADLQGNLLYANPFFLNSMGISSSDFIGRNINDFHKVSDGNFMDCIADELQNTRNWKGECACNFKSGQTHWVYSFFFIINNPVDGEDLIMILSFDITEQKQKQFNEERYNRIIQEKYEMMTEDLELAAKTQKVFMMPSFVETRNLNIYTYMRPLIHVTGDVLSHKLNLDGSVDIMLADVAGHGLSSAYFTSSLVFIFQNLSPDSITDPAKILNSIYNKIRYISKEIFICAAIIRIKADNTIEYSYAGLLPMIIKSKNKWSILDGRGTPITNGLDLSFTNYTRTIERGDEILLFSDGCFELSDENEKIFGYSGLLEYLKSHSEMGESNPAQTIMRNLFAVSNNKFNDDVTFAVVQVL